MTTSRSGVIAGTSLAVLWLAACNPPQPGSPKDLDPIASEPHRLPTGALLDPAGRSFSVGPFPLAMLPAPEGDRVLLALNGYRDEGLQVFQPATGKVLQTVPQAAGFLGMAFDSRGTRLYASGGNQDVVYRYDWKAGAATLADSIVLAAKAPRQPGTRYPAGLALSRDDRYVYVAENLADSLAVIELESGQVVQRLPAGRYPYGVVVAPDGTVYVSAWGGFEVRAFRRIPAIESASSRLETGPVIRVGRHPSALLLNREGTRLFVASASTDRVSVVDTKAARVITELVDTVPGGTGEGSTPNALALSPSGQRLFVAEADNNAVAIFDLSAATSGAGVGIAPDRLAGRIPVEWYPSALLVRGDTLLVANAKGKGTKANPQDGPGPGRPGSRPGYTLSQLSGTVSVVPLAGVEGGALTALSARVARANGWGAAHTGPGYPPFQHVIYIIKENRTYDQVLGDLRQADGDTSLVFFGRAISPNHHALAERFGIFDRFFVNAEVSGDGHNWSTAAYATDYVDKTVQLNYSDRGRSYDFEGQNRGKRPAAGEDAGEPANGYLWDLAQRRGITFRNFGEFVRDAEADDTRPPPAGYRGLKPFLESHTDSTFPGFDLKIPDQHRADLWIAQLARWEKDGSMPALQIFRLPNDHTAGGRAGEPTPKAYMADNDLALGRAIEALSKSSYWKNTVVFVLEDDAQNGPDHVDSHRSPLLVISAYNRPRVWHRWANTTDVLKTIEEMLTLKSLSQFDAFGRPLRGIFEATPDPAPYTALRPAQSLEERNPAAGPGVRESEALDLRLEDQSDDETFNRALWLAIKGTKVPYPGNRVMSGPVRGAER
jgi:YVTN family beta-propeller protein